MMHVNGFTCRPVHALLTALLTIGCMLVRINYTVFKLHILMKVF